MGIYIIIVMAILLLSVLYIFSTFIYDVNDDFINIKWKIFKVVPFNSKKIMFENIANITSDRNFEGVAVWGNLIRKKGIIIKLKKGVIKNLYITPSNPDIFIRQIKNKISNLKQ